VKVWRTHTEPGSAGAPGVITAGGALVTADGVLALDEVQPEGKRAMSGAAWRAGLRTDASVGPS
jgi:methionyl-tRNA formyltransferase